ncbi:MAG: hypothetical protein ACQETI_01885 [Halobacteriota archaeon]
MTDRIEWAITPADSRFLRVASYVPWVVFGGAALLVLAVLGLLSAAALLAGRFEVIVVGAAILFVGFLSSRYLLVLSSSDTRHLLVPAEATRPTRRVLLLAAAVGAVSLALAALVAPALAIAFLVAAPVTAIVVAVLQSEGVVDSDSLLLQYGTKEVSLDGLRRVRSITVAAFTFAWLSFDRGTVDAFAPRILVIPTEDYSAVDSVFETAIALDGTPGRTVPPAERAIVLTFALGLLAVGPVLWFALPPTGDARLVAGYAGLLMGLFGLLLLWYATVS